MKKLLIIAILGMAYFVVNAQNYIPKERARIEASKYASMDTTTHRYAIPIGITKVFARFTSLDTTDAVMKVGYTDFDGKAHSVLNAPGNPWTLDNTNPAYLVVTNYEGVTWTNYSILIVDPCMGGSVIYFDIIWNGVTSGDIVLYW